MEYTVFKNIMDIVNKMVSIEVSNVEIKDFLINRGINVTDDQVNKLLN